MFGRIFLGVVLAACLTPLMMAGDEVPQKTPIILDTDIGTDIDDAFALALAVASPELDLRGVTTVSADAYTRAMIACRFLYAVGRADVPVAAGRPPRNAPAIRGQYQYGLRPARKRPVREDTVEFLRRQLEASPGKLTIVTVGDLTNIGNLITRHPECKSQIKRIVIMGGAVRVGYRNQPPPEPEWNIKSDVRASQIVFSSGIPIVVAPLDATTMLKLEEPLRRDIFSADTPLTRQLATLYDLWNKPTPVLFDPVAVTLCFTERFCTMEPLRLEVDDRGLTREVKGQPNARVATAIRREEFLRWYVDRVVGHPIVVRLSADGTFRLDDRRLNGEQLARRLEQLARQRADVNVEIRTQHGVESEIGQSAVGLCRDAGIDRVAVSPNDGSPAFGNVTTPVPRRGMPSRVHVIENYETDIENRWWLAGRIETENVPRSLSASIPNHRTCRATMTRNFDGKMGDQSLTYKAVIFNPVPGPPMGPRTRLSFRYFLTGTDRVRVQIYSLTNGYHRYLTLAGLPQGQWQSATVDMTTARRPDGSGGPLAENERIDDIQFYIDPSGELLIDDIVLCDEADENEKRPFPSRFIFTGWFDTGRQGAEWPGDFEIVPHEKPLAWKAARSVINEKTGRPWIRVHLRGRRRVSEQTALSFRYKLTGTGDLRVVMANSETGQLFEAVLENPAVGRWTAADLIFRAPPKTGDSPVFVDEVRFLIDAGRQLLVDDMILLSASAAALSSADGAGVVNPHVRTDRAPDFRTIDSLVKSVAKEGMTHEQKVLAVFHVVRRNFVHGPTPRNVAYDFHRIQHSLGTGACLSMTTPLQVVYERMGYKCQSWVHNGHHMMQVYYDDGWHCLDPHMTFCCYDRSTPPKIASLEQLRADPTLAHNAVEEGRAGSGYLLCGDSPAWFASQKDNPRDHWRLEAGGRWPNMTIEEPFGQITLRRGETYVRTWWPGEYWFKAGWLERDGCGPIHHCGSADRKDTANWPLFEPHGAKPGFGHHKNRTFYKIWAVGRLTYKPDFAGHYADAVISRKNLKSAAVEGTAALAQEDASEPGEVIFSVNCPYVITAGDLTVAGTKGKLSAAVSVDAGKTWKSLALATSDGTFHANFVDEVNGSWEGYWLKLELSGGAKLARLELVSHFQLNRFSLPHLVPGKNVVTVTADKYGSPMTVAYKWHEGTAWSTPRAVEKTFTKNGEFEIQVAGPKHPRMASLTLSVAP